MTQDAARIAAVEIALDRVQPGMVIGLGSGRAVFALADAIGKRWPQGAPITGVAASPQTAQIAAAAGIPLRELTNEVIIDISFDGADEVDPAFNMIKGGGAALLTEKLVLSVANEVVIMIEDVKLVERLGATRLLPVEVVKFGWTTTQERLLDIVDTATLRTNSGEAVVTSEGHYLLDIEVPAEIGIEDLARQLKLTLGVVEHGLFIDEADELIVGYGDGSIRLLPRP